MKCGCSGSATISVGFTEVPCCLIHGCSDKMDPQPDLDGRVATCSICAKFKKSSADLPFFRYRSDQVFDQFYCFCREFGDG